MGESGTVVLLPPCAASAPWRPSRPCSTQSLSQDGEVGRVMWEAQGHRVPGHQVSSISGVQHFQAFCHCSLFWVQSPTCGLTPQPCSRGPIPGMMGGGGDVRVCLGYMWRIPSSQAEEVRTPRNTNQYGHKKAFNGIPPPPPGALDGRKQVGAQQRWGGGGGKWRPCHLPRPS